MIKLESWLEAGYRRYEVHDKGTSKLADFILQRRYDDDQGAKYFITTYCYDRMKYPEPHKSMFIDSPHGFMPSAHFQLGEGQPFFEIEMNSVEQMNSISEIEQWYDKFWTLLGKPYYEVFE